jgi:hypothetical protein
LSSEPPPGQRASLGQLPEPPLAPLGEHHPTPSSRLPDLTRHWDDRRGRCEMKDACPQADRKAPDGRPSSATSRDAFRHLQPRDRIATASDRSGWALLSFLDRFSPRSRSRPRYARQARLRARLGRPAPARQPGDARDPRNAGLGAAGPRCVSWRDAGLALLVTQGLAAARAASFRGARRSPRSRRDHAARPWPLVRAPRRTCAHRPGRTR